MQEDGSAHDIEIEEVVKIFSASRESVVALEGVTLSVERRGFASLLGPSGCGKSTLLRLVAGLMEPTQGRVRLAGRDVHGPQTDLGMVFQTDVLLDWRTVLGNVLLPTASRRFSSNNFAERANELLALVGLRDFEGRLPYELSGGMRQRVAICRALLTDPARLLMDEPFGALDALTRDQLGLDLQRLWMEEPKTVLFVTHSIEEAVFLSDKVAVMTPRPGRIQEIVDVDLPRPRLLSIKHTPEFAAHVGRIRDLFLASGVLREESI